MADSDLDKIDTGVPSDAENPEAEKVDTAGAAGGLISSGGVIALLFISSVIVVTKGGIYCQMYNNCVGIYIYALVVGAVSIVLSALYMLLSKLNKLNVLPGKHRLFFAAFMFVWWTFGAGILTFKGSYMGVFINTGNGYFACWIAWGCSSWLLKSEFHRVQAVIDRFQTMGMVSWLLLCSCVELFAAISACNMPGISGCPDGLSIWALVAGAVSCLVALLLMFVPAIAKQVKFIAIFLSFWWVAGAGANTFKGPFTQTGNGYFASWACLIVSLLLLQPHMGV